MVSDAAREVGSEWVRDELRAEPCVFNKRNAAGVQISLTLHVDDLLTTCKSETEIDLFFAYLRIQFPVITVHKGQTLSYLGRMLFDFREEGMHSIRNDTGGRMRGGKMLRNPRRRQPLRNTRCAKGL